MIRDMNDLSIFSVENLAALADIHTSRIIDGTSRIIDGRALRRRAQEWLEAHPSRQEESEMAKLRAQNEALLKNLYQCRSRRHRLTAELHIERGTI
jgi:hypothetical protein